MPNRPARVLGLSASLRNARFGAGSESLVRDLKRMDTQDALYEYLQDQARIRLEDFVSAGRSQSLGFDEIYRNLQDLRSDQGLSNSEVVLAAGLWGAYQLGCEIAHLGLSRHFPAHKRGVAHADELRARLMSADAILLATPVYFGDRSSVAHDLIETIRSDSKLVNAMRGKVFAGVSVGAKRNGGQETSLIYQMLDLTAIGMLGVGNDSDTTSQYGGTAHAGDVGTAGVDTYGLNTSVGAGKRLGHVAEILRSSEQVTLNGPLRIHVWLLQDSMEVAKREVQQFVDALDSSSERPVEFTVLDFTDSDVHRCIACDICPTDVDRDEVYRCIIHRKQDALKKSHSLFLEPDAVIVVANSPVDRGNLASTYQRFMERTRYLRRGDYVLSDVVVAPLVFEELGSKENLHLRMLTSMLRHHTIMTHPIIAYRQGGAILNRDQMMSDLDRFLSQVARVVAGRGALLSRKPPVTHYNPVGYVLTAMKDKEAETTRRREDAVAARVVRKTADSRHRVHIRPPD